MPPGVPPGVLPAAVLGTWGSVALAVGATHVGVLPARVAGGWFGFLPASGGDRVVGNVTAWAGVAALAAAWWWLRRLAAGGAPVGAVLAVAALWCLPLLPAPPVGSRDAYSYVAQAQQAAQGLEPHEAGPVVLGPGPVLASVDRIWRGTPSPYGPAWLGLAGVPADALAPDVPAAVLAMRALAVGGVALLAAGVVALARQAGADPAHVAALVVANPVTVVHLVGGAHNEALMMGLAVVAVAIGRRWPLAGVALGALAGAVKAPALLAGAWVAWAWIAAPGPVPLTRRAGRAALAAGAGLATLHAAAVVTGLGWSWVGSLDVGGRIRALLSSVTTVGVLAERVLGGEGALDAVRGAATVASASLALALVLLAPRRPLPVLGAALGVLALLAANVQPWYLLWALPFTALGPPTRGRLAVLGTLSVVAVASTQPKGGAVVRNLATLPWVLAVPLTLALAAATAVLLVAAAREAGPLPARAAVLRVLQRTPA